MTIFTFPAIEPNTSTFGLVANTQIFQSPFDKSVQSVELPGARWAASLTFNDLAQENYQVMNAFLVQLRGRAGHFYLHNHAQPYPMGSGAGTPLVKGGSQTGASLVTDGWSALSLVLKAGDLFGVGGELKMITGPITSDANGEATLIFEPPLRASPSDNAVITVNKPTAIFALESDEVPIWSNAKGRRYSIAFNCREVF